MPPPSFYFIIPFWDEKKKNVLVCKYFEWKKLITQCPLSWGNQIQKIL